MTLSADIRRGAEMTKPLKRYLFRIRNGQIETCAMGAALFGGGFQDVTVKTNLINKKYMGSINLVLIIHYTHLSRACVLSPCDCKFNCKINLGNAIGHLNDNHDWTREAIADWLESLGY